MKNGTAFGAMAISAIACTALIILEIGLHSPLKLLGAVLTGGATLFFSYKFFKTL